MLDRELILNYAEALYAAASEQEVQHKVREDLDRVLAFTLHEPEGLRRLSYTLNSARVSSENKHAVLAALCEALEVGRMSADWLALVAENGRLNLLPHFIRAFIEEYRIREKVFLASIETAFDIPKKKLGDIRKSLEETLKASVELDLNNNPELIAGIRVRVAGRVWDMSVKGALEKTQLQYT